MHVVFEIEIAIQKTKDNIKQIRATTFISFVSFDVVSYQEALFCLNKVMNFQIEHSQTNYAVGILIHFLIDLIAVQSLCESCDTSVPKTCLIVAFPQFEVNVSHLDRQHPRTTLETENGLLVVNSCSLKL